MKVEKRKGDAHSVDPDERSSKRLKSDSKKIDLGEMTDQEVIKVGAKSVKGLEGQALVDTMKRISRDIERARTKVKDRTGPIIKNKTKKEDVDMSDKEEIMEGLKSFVRSKLLGNLRTASALKKHDDLIDLHGDAAEKAVAKGDDASAEKHLDIVGRNKRAVGRINKVYSNAQLGEDAITETYHAAGYVNDKPFSISYADFPSKESIAKDNQHLSPEEHSAIYKHVEDHADDDFTGTESTHNGNKVKVTHNGGVHTEAYIPKKHGPEWIHHPDHAKWKADQKAAQVKQTIRKAKPIDPSDSKLHDALGRELGGNFEHYESEPKHGHNEHGHATMIAHVTHSYTHDDLGMKPEEMDDTSETYKVKVTKHPQHGYHVGLIGNMSEAVKVGDFNDKGVPYAKASDLLAIAKMIAKDEQENSQEKVKKAGPLKVTNKHIEDARAVYFGSPTADRKHMALFAAKGREMFSNKDSSGHSYSHLRKEDTEYEYEFVVEEVNDSNQAHLYLMHSDTEYAANQAKISDSMEKLLAKELNGEELSHVQSLIQANSNKRKLLFPASGQTKGQSVIGAVVQSAKNAAVYKALAAKKGK